MLKLKFRCTKLVFIHDHVLATVIHPVAVGGAGAQDGAAITDCFVKQIEFLGDIPEGGVMMTDEYGTAPAFKPGKGIARGERSAGFIKIDPLLDLEQRRHTIFHFMLALKTYGAIVTGNAGLAVHG